MRLSGGLGALVPLEERANFARNASYRGPYSRFMSRCAPRLGRILAPPAKHCAIAIQRCATSPATSSLVSAALRTWVTVRQKSTALPLTRLVSLGSFHSQIAPDGATSRT